MTKKNEKTETKPDQLDSKQDNGHTAGAAADQADKKQPAEKKKDEKAAAPGGACFPG